MGPVNLLLLSLAASFENECTFKIKIDSHFESLI